MADDFNKPNVVIPLAMSYDTRNVNASAAIVAGYDQQKVNMFYEVIRNPVTGNNTLELVKRPGVAQALTVTGSVNRQYLILDVLRDSNPWMFYERNNGDLAVSNNGNDTLILSTTTYHPAYAETTILSGTPTAVFQIRTGTSPSLRVFYATAIGTWTEISDSVFTGLSHRGAMAFMDGYAFVMDANNKIYNSSLNTLATWPSTNFISKQIVQDRAAGLAKFKNLILAFGDETVEIFRNAGNPSGSPLSAIPTSSERYGLSDISGNSTTANQITGRTSYYAVLKERMYFAGRETGRGGNQGIYSFNGQSFEKVSTGTIDRILSAFNVYSIYKTSILGKTGIAVQIVAPGTATQQWMFFIPEWNDWFHWTSSVFSPVNDAGFHLRASDGGTQVYAFNQVNGWTDAGTTYTGTVQFKIPKKGNNRDFMRWCALDADTTTSASNVTVEFSDDDYQTFSTGRTIDLNTSEKRLNRCGSYKTPRVVKLSHSANVEFRARNFLARID